MMGSLLAKKLQFTLWDQKLVQAIADHTGLSSSFLQALDEHSRSKVEDIIAGALMGYEGAEMAYVSQLHRIVHTIEKNGSGVIIGRGAQFIVDASKALRVRLIAPLDTRIRWVSEREGLNTKDAEKKIKSIDKERFDFHRHYFSKDVDKPSYYDLVLNTSMFPSDHAVNVITNSYKEKFDVNV
jgi:cytidylate kinase